MGPGGIISVINVELFTRKIPHGPLSCPRDMRNIFVHV